MNARAKVGFVALAAFAAPAGAAVSPVDGSTARYLDNNDGRDWPGYGRTFGEQHYSPLTQINQGSIRRLGLLWSMNLGSENSVTQPIAVDGVLYFATGYSVVQAVEAASGKLLWRYDPKAAEKAGLNLRFGWGSRGIAWWNGKIYTGTQDGRLIAIDAKTGAPAWSAQTFDPNTVGYITGAPRVFDGKVIMGYSGDTGASRGYVTTYNAETGQYLWRFYTVPGNPAEGFENPAMERAAKSWAGQWWKFGGGGHVWNAMAYDVETDTVFLGTGNGYPVNRRARSEDQGDNLFVASIVALDGKTGAYQWHYQVNPGDTWDYDATTDIELAELPLAGQSRQVLMQAAKNGFFYVIDRHNGKLLSAEPYAKVTWAKRIDLNTGRPVENSGARYPNESTADIWPSGVGAHSWMPLAYSPKTRLAYIPMLEMGGKVTDKGIDLKHWQPPTDRALAAGNAFNGMPEGGLAHFYGALVAWNPVTQKAMWNVHHSTLANGGVLATGGGLVFQGTLEGTFKAYSDTTGRRLWTYPVQAPLIAPSISYSVNGKQYLTVLTGLGTSAGLFARAAIEQYGIDPRHEARRVLTFALHGKATLTLPKAARVGSSAVRDPEFKTDARIAAAGQALYNRHCLVCHGFSAVGSTHAPDLRRSAIPLSGEAFTSVVHDGTFIAKGMPAFGELTETQLANLRQYIRTETKRLRKRTDSEDRIR